MDGVDESWIVSTTGVLVVIVESAVLVPIVVNDLKEWHDLYDGHHPLKESVVVSPNSNIFFFQYFVYQHCPNDPLHPVRTVYP
jgi:hypothetical protein